MCEVKKHTSFGTKVAAKIEQFTARHYCVTSLKGTEYYLNADNQTLIKAFFKSYNIEILDIQDLGIPEAGYEYLSESTWEDMPRPFP